MPLLVVVFNVTAQFGKTFGLAALSVISSTVSQAAAACGGIDPSEVLMQGYRAAFWTNFGIMITTICVATLGLRHVRHVGKDGNNDNSKTMMVDESAKGSYVA